MPHKRCFAERGPVELPTGAVFWGLALVFDCECDCGKPLHPLDGDEAALPDMI